MIFEMFEDLMIPINIVVVGPKNTGKTSLIKKLNLGEIDNTTIAIGNVETIQTKTVSFTVLDFNVIGIDEKLRPLWRYYTQNTKALIYVIDSSDRERISEARIKLHRLLQEEVLRDSVLLIFANKQDIPNAMRPTEIKELLGLNLIYGRNWYLKGTSLKTVEGIEEGILWLSLQLKKIKT